MLNFFSMLFGGKTIAGRVMQTLKQRVVSAQEAHDSYCKSLRETHEAEVAKMEAAMVEAKATNMDNLVSEILK